MALVWPEVLDPLGSRNVCVLRWSFPGMSQAVGSGFLIGPRVVLTAGHNMYDPWLGGWASEIVVEFPGLAGIPAQTFEPINFWVNADSSSQDRGLSVYDYAVVVLGQRIDTLVPVLRLHDGAPLPAGTVLSVSGTPSDRDVPQYTGRFCQGQNFIEFPSFWASFLPHRLFYAVRTMRGMSGGPVWTAGAGGAVAVGVHTSFNNRGDGLGSGVGITPDAVALINQWLTKYP